MAEHTSIMTAPKRILTDAMIAEIEALAPRYPDRRALTLPALHIVNDALRHVPLQAVVEIAAVRDANFGSPVVWVCDPMHGNTRVTASGYKTRDFDDILSELKCVGKHPR